MYSAEYRKKSNRIDETVNEYFIHAVEKIIGGLNNNDKLHFFFAIMELESWLLGLYRNLERMHNSLTPENIRINLGFDLQVIDPETEFFQPAVQLKLVLGLANIRYDKHKSEMENILSRITLEDIEQLIATNRCKSFASFFTEIQRELLEAHDN